MNSEIRPQKILHDIDDDRFIELCLLYLDGVIEQSEFDELSSLLNSDGKKRDAFVALCIHTRQIAELGHPYGIKVDKEQDMSVVDEALWQALADNEKTAEAIKTETPVEPELKYIENRNNTSGSRSVSKLSLIAFLLSSAAILFISVLVWLTPIKPLVASLTRDVNAEWLDDYSVLEEDGGIRAGKLQLIRGMAQIEFYGGAQIILQGPADVEFISQDKMFISSGKLVARVKRDAIGFIVDTPEAKTLDLGTEFGVDVTRGHTEVHVFDGEVAIYPGDSDKKILIEQGQAKQVDYTGKVNDLDAQEQVFVRTEEFDANFKADQGSSYHRWISYNYQLHQDPGLAAHYTFDRVQGKSEVLLNHAPVSVGKLDGILGGTSHNKPDWVSGRWPGKTALEFDREKGQRIAVAADSALCISGPITIAAWVKFPDDMVGGHVVSHRDMYKVNYQMSYDGSNYAGARPGAQLQFRRYFGRNTLDGFQSQNETIRPDRWYLIAATHDNHTVRLYKNGYLLLSEEFEFKAEPVDAELVIGDVNIAGFEQKRFNGTIGELAIFKRVLSYQEIKQMYEAGKPY